MYFVVSPSDANGLEIELVEGGATKPVTWETRLEYADLVERWALDQYRPQLGALARGLGRMVRLLCTDTMKRLSLNHMHHSGPH